MLAEIRGRIMGTDAHLVVDESHAELLSIAWNRLQALEALWSRFVASSDVGRLNRASGGWVEVAPETADLVAYSVDAWRATAGRFDPTVGSAMVANGYGRSFSDGPTPTRRTRPAAGPAGIDFEGGAIRVPVGVKLDLGGIAKGRAADLVVAELRALGARGAAVGLGGDVRVAGTRPDGRLWELTLPNGEVFAKLADGAVCMSTVAKRRWTSEGETRHHIVDPRTGRCTDGAVTSAAVAGASATQAEVITKSLLVAYPAAAAAELAGLGLRGRLWLGDGRTVDMGQVEATA